MGKKNWIAFAAALAFAPAAFATSDETSVALLRDRIEIAWQARDSGAIESARESLLRTGADAAPFYAAYARFRQALIAEGDADRARGYVDACIDELRTYIAQVPGDAEARALLGSCYGISTRYHRLGMASRGLEARRQMAAARELAPANPWVVLQDGLADYATPRLFGGDRALAIRKLERATDLFAAAMQEGSRRAAWGAAETWLQLGQMYRETGREGDARVALENARRLAPSGQQVAAL